MSNQITEILQFIFANRTISLSEAEQLIAAHIEANQAGRNADNLYPAVREALDHSAEFAQSYQELVELITNDRTDEKFENLADATLFNLSFLNQRTNNQQQQIEWRVTEAGNVIIKLTRNLVQRAFETAEALNPNTTFDPAVSLAGQLRSNQKNVNLLTFEEANDLSLNISIDPDSEAEGSCSILCAIDVPSLGGWPNLADIEIKLASAKEEMTDIQYTDPFGKATFNNIKVDTLQHLIFTVSS